jgi:hypothetical protein
MSEVKNMQLRELVPQEWFKEISNSTFWLRIYSCLFIPHADFLELVLAATKKTGFASKISFRFMAMNEMKMPTTEMSMISQADGMLKINAEIKNSEVKTGTYVFMMTPKRIDGVNIPEFEVRETLNICAGILRAHAGHNFMRDVIYEGEVHAGKDGFTLASEGLKLPHPTEGPHFNNSNWEQSKEIYEAVGNLQKEIRNRIHLSLNYFNKAFDEEDSFFFYWVSLEILCNGKSQTIKQRIREALDLKSLKDVEEIGFGVISKWRHEFFHQGIRPTMAADVDRYIQLLYLDLLRYIVRVPPAFHTLSLLNNPGYDLTSIGIIKKST